MGPQLLSKTSIRRVTGHSQSAREIKWVTARALREPKRKPAPLPSAPLRISRGFRVEACDPARAAYGWIGEGFDTADPNRQSLCSIGRLESRCLTSKHSAPILTIDGQLSIGRGTLCATVSVAQAKSQFAALVARAEAGEKIIVTRSGRAVACLGPLPGRKPIKYGELRGAFLSEDLTIPERVIRDFEPGK